MPSAKARNARKARQAQMDSSLMSQFADEAAAPSPLLVDLDLPAQAQDESDWEPDGERVGAVDMQGEKGYDEAQSADASDGEEPVEGLLGLEWHAGRADTGHVRAPILSRQPTRFESISKTVHNYVPSSIAIAIPSAALSPPIVSRPVSFGKFMTSSGNDEQSQDYEDTSRRRSWGPEMGQKTLDEVLSLENTGGSPAPELMRYPSDDASERITWARWDTLPPSGDSKAKRLLFLGYLSGMQIWDCTNLDTLSEVLNLPDTGWGRVWSALVLPPPLVPEDSYLRSRPLIGIIAKQGHRTPDFIVYSLSSHSIIKRFAVPGLVSFSSNSNFIILSTSNPLSLRILSSSTFETLSVISSTSLLPFSRRLPRTVNNNINQDTNVLVPESVDPEAPPPEHEPHPVYALSHRLLAITTPPPRTDFPGLSSLPTRPSGPAMLAANIVQSDIGGVAMRVGTSMLSSMRSLGGFAITAARTRLTSDATPVPSPPTKQFASRSAPAASRRFSSVGAGQSVDISDAPAAAHTSASTSPTSNFSPPPPTRDTYVTIMNLMPLLVPSRRTERQPEVVAEFISSKHRRVSALRFSASGTQVIVIPEDGQTALVYDINSASRSIRELRRAEVEADAGGATASKLPEGQPWHIYDLRRGRTNAVVEGVDGTQDGRWIAIGSRNRTVHIFPTNPYGGVPDERSHMSGRVYNPSERPTSLTHLYALVRMRSKHVPLGESIHPPLAFSFVSPVLGSLPKRLLPPPIMHSPPSSTPASVSSSPSPEPLSPPGMHRPTNFQDILLFDPVDGALSLRRFFVELRPTEQHLSIPSSVPGIGGASISLPTRTSFGGISASPPSGSSGRRAQSSALSQMLEKPVELVGRESEVAMWNLRRGRNWEATRRPLVTNAPSAKKTVVQRGKSTWLSQAELQTSSSSTRVVQRPIYLSHQFLFFELGEDYHGSLRRYQLDISGPRIDVRKEVEISAYPTGSGEAFVHGSYGTRGDTGREPSSFDEPLSSAIASELEYATSQPVIPMFPNGSSGSKPASFKNSVPIQRMADGMSEGLGRLRREMSKVRSPRLIARASERGAGEPMPLEFDEEDENFLLSDDPHSGQTADGSSRRSTSREAQLASAPSTGMGAFDVHDKEVEGAWLGWEAEDRQAIDDAEQFHEISVVGFMDEEQQEQRQKQEENEKGRKRAAKRKAKRAAAE